MLQLRIQQPPQGFVAATVPVRWSIDKNLIDTLAGEEFVKPYLVLSVRAVSKHTVGDGSSSITVVEAEQTALQILPLDAMLTHVSFARPGTNHLLAMVVDVSDRYRMRMLHGWNRNNIRVFDDDGSWRDVDRDQGRTLKRVATTTELEVEVPAEMFAKPLSGFWAALIARFFTQRARDQCENRGRRVLSLLAAFGLLTVGQVVKFLITLGALVGGVWPLNLKELLHPWHGIFDPITEVEGDHHCIWFTDHNGNVRASPLWIVNAITLIFPALIIYGIIQARALSEQACATTKASTLCHYTNYRYGFPGVWKTFALVDGSLFALALFTVLVALLYFEVDTLQSRLRHSERARVRFAKREMRRSVMQKTSRSRMLSRLEPLTLDGEATLDAIPKDKRTIRLKFWNLKAKVCRPYPR